ncbi:MAG: ATP-dependent helicase [Deltaproteobacteria bacterium]|nr:MAG: ATP-dependent helicase [Deltaproteobacteria bacterium]
MRLSDLNPGQQAAVTAPDGVQLVVAGAGTGKTRTLVHRVAWLVDEGVDPRDIVLLTFTRRAAREMLDRASAMVGDQAKAVRGGTFHSFAVSALRRHADALGYSRDFTVLDRADAEALVGLVRGEVGLGGRERRAPQRRTLLKLVSKQINTGRPLADLIDASYPQYLEFAPEIERLAVRYTERKREQNVMDFDDLLVRMVELLRDHPDRREHLARGVRYLLVDEYQDTNRLQAEITGLLSYLHGNLMVVGDEAQSIYGFRGADVRNILDFTELFPHAEVIRLEQNYRSVQPVLDLANGVLQSAAEGYGKVLFSERSSPERPELVTTYDEQEQASYLAQRVQERKAEGLDYRSQAVLFRSGYHSNLLEVELQRAGVAFRKFGGLKFVEASHVRDVFALLRVVANPRDVMAWVRILQWFAGLGAVTAERIAQKILDHPEHSLEPTPYRKRKYGPALAHLAQVLSAAAPLSDRPEALVAHLLEYYAPLLETLYEDHRKRVNDLKTLTELASKYTDLESLLAEVALDPPEQTEIDADPAEEDWLTLSTIHSAKGLEWAVVYVMQLGDGHFPTTHAVEDPDALEEERRLLYVAVTRARDALELVRPTFLRGRFGVQPTECALLDEIPAFHSKIARRDGQLRGASKTKPTEKHPDIAAAEARLAEFMRRFPRKG